MTMGRQLAFEILDSRERRTERSRSAPRLRLDAEFRCGNEGSAAAWAAWPDTPRNPYRAGTPEHEAWAFGARASHRARGDRDYCPALWEQGAGANE